MNNVEQLFIRACKSKDSQKRIRSVYRRFYLGGFGPDPQGEAAILSILSNIADKHMQLKIGDLLSDLHPDRDWYFDIKESDSYFGGCIKVLASRIRLTEAAKFVGLTKPGRFRTRLTA